MWNEGYTSEIGYTYGCYRELSPCFIRNMRSRSPALSQLPSQLIGFLNLA